MDVPVTLFRSESVQLWVNITNEGKTPIKRMRARLKIHQLPIPSILPSRPRPDNVSEQTWQGMVKVRAEFETRMQEALVGSRFGRPLPFSRTPKGTIGLPWVEADDRTTYEVDLSPLSDEASVKLIGLYPLDSVALGELERTGFQLIGHPAGSPIPNVNVVATQIGNTSGLNINPGGEGLLYDFALKFWIVSENITKDVSEIFHVEIPKSLNDIICTRLKKGSMQYKEFEKILAT